MKIAAKSKSAFIEKNQEKIWIAIGFCERRISVISGHILTEAAQAGVFSNNALDNILDELYELYAYDKQFDLSRTSWYRPLIKKM